MRNGLVVDEQRDTTAFPDRRRLRLGLGRSAWLPRHCSAANLERPRPDHEVGDVDHLRCDGSIHRATTPALGAEMVAEGVGRPFPYAHGWTLASVEARGVDGAVALFRRNYDRLRPVTRHDGF